MTDRELMQRALDALEEAQDYTSCPTFSPSMTQQCAIAAVAIRARLEQNDFNPDWDAMAVMVEEQQRMAKRIEELEARLAQPEPEPEKNQDKPCVEDDGCPTEKAVLQRFWREHQAQPEQEPVTTLFGSLPVYNVVTQPEPVAWSHNYISDNVITHRPADIDRYPDRWTALYKDPTPCQICESLARTVMMDQTSHDTAPPQREWQTLTENEIKHLWYEACQTNLELTSQLIVHLARNIEAKLKEKNHG